MLISNDLVIITHCDPGWEGLWGGDVLAHLCEKQIACPVQGIGADSRGTYSIIGYCESSYKVHNGYLKKVEAKSDATTSRKPGGKTRFTLLDFKFLGAMAKNMAAGIKDRRARDDWRRLKWDEATRQEYVDALYRHTIEKFDPVAAACNLMIIWVNDKEKNKSPNFKVTVTPQAENE
jgi:hypothetical protein